MPFEPPTPLHLFPSYSQAAQDVFAYAMNGGHPGTFLDIGSAHPILNNNTYGLECLGWHGLCLDKDPAHTHAYATQRTTPFYAQDALTFDLPSLLSSLNLPPTLSYLSLDADDDTLPILEYLLSTPLRFSSITIEHDSYRLGDYAKNRMRYILSNASYRLVRPDVSFNTHPFEDWWVDGSSLRNDPSLASLMQQPITTAMNLPPPITDYIQQRLQPNSKLTMEGWCTPEKATALAECVLATNPKIAIEIGVFAGRSLFAIGLAQAHLANNGVALGIDPWSPSASIVGFEDDPANRDWWSKVDHSAIYRLCEDVKNDLALSNVSLYRGTSSQALPALTLGRTDPFINLLHIDGNHSQQVALHDVQHYGPLVTPGSFIIFDDCDWSTTVPAQQELNKLATFVRMVGNCGIFVRK